MSLRECLISAAEQGAITREEAADLAGRFDEIHAQARLSLGDDAARAAAKDQLERELRYAAAEKARRARLDAAAGARLKAQLQAYRGANGEADIFEAALGLIENHGYTGASSIAGKAKAIAGLAHAEMADMMRTFRRGFAGGRLNKPVAKDIVRELHGETTNKPEVKAMADAWRTVAEKLRLRFNGAGGAIAKLDDWALAHAHDPVAVLGAGRAAWIDFVMPRLDRARMRDLSTGEALDDAGLARLLSLAWDNIVSDGSAHMTPQAQPQGRGMLASQRQEHRVLHFKTADDWMAYDAEFGRGDPVAAMFEHIRGMSQDIATMEILGPNPAARLEWLSQVVQREAGRALVGEPSLFRLNGAVGQAAIDKPSYVDYRLKSVYEYVTGVGPVSRRVAIIAGNVRNLLTSALLGGAPLVAATTDPFFDASARHLSGLPVAKSFAAILKTFDGASREQIARSGIVVEEFLHILGDQARYAGTMHGQEWSRWLADQTIRKSGLHAITEARRAMFARDFQAVLADAAASGWEELSPRLRGVMEGYGIDRTDWQLIRATPPSRPAPDAAGFIRPVDIAAMADGPALADVQTILGLTEPDAAAARDMARAGAVRTAEKVTEMIQQQMERAVPTGVMRMRSLIAGPARPGTVAGELMQSVLMFKGFALSMMSLQIEAVMREVGTFGVAAGARYAGGISLGLTLGGALAIHLSSLWDGKDPEPMTSRKFWGAAILKGGGLGLAGDFLFADQNRFGGSLGQTLAGPAVGLVDTVLDISVGNAQKALAGEDTEIGKDAIAMARRYTPLASSLWYTRTAYRRVILDQLQYAADPQAHRKFRAQEKKLFREHDQHFWWRPGAAAPDRPPALFAD